MADEKLGECPALSTHGKETKAPSANEKAG
jgi:hypothetical protein